MDGRIRAVAAPLVGVGSLLGTQVAWLPQHPALAVVSLLATVLVLLIPLVLVCRLAWRVLADALKRGTSVHLSYHGLQIHVGRNAISQGSNADHQGD
jgi:hypothetical protein